MICAGIDAGSRAIKVALLDASSGELVASGVADQGVGQKALARGLFAAVLRGAGLGRSKVKRIVATGYGRDGVGFAHETITEITCHARGARHHCPTAGTVIDIGGQDSKIIRLSPDGSVRDFSMNDRCAAGSGRFLEVVARRLDKDLKSLGRLAAGSARRCRINSMCVVFAESEIIGLMAAGERPGNIVAGVQSAIASRVASMAGRRLAAPVVLSGGVALIPGMAGALEEALGCKVAIAPRPQLVGALGAALLASDALAHP